jgi:hypothetical protein
MDIYKQLATIQAQRKVLEAQEAEVKLAIMNEMEKHEVESVTNKYGKFTYSARRSWIYSEAVDRMMEKIKLAKLKEEKRGIATPKITNYLTFTPNKQK